LPLKQQLFLALGESDIVSHTASISALKGSIRASKVKDRTLVQPGLSSQEVAKPRLKPPASAL
jgi:hypothetical protein